MKESLFNNFSQMMRFYIQSVCPSMIIFYISNLIIYTQHLNIAQFVLSSKPSVSRKCLN